MKLKSLYISLVALILSGAFTSCREDGPRVFNPNDQRRFINWADLFDSYWNGMNYSYAFWDVDPTDWDKVYEEYLPRFSGLEFGVAQDSVRAMELFTELTANLVDHHYHLILKKEDGSWFANISPGLTEAGNRDYYHDVIDEKQLRDNFRNMERSGRVTDMVERYDRPAEEFVLYTCLIDESIVYLRLSEFDIYLNIGNEDITDVIDQYLNLVNDTPDLRGIIIDLRGNPGGTLADGNIIPAPLLNTPLTFGYTRTKVGMGRLDYTPWSPMVLMPQEEGEKDVTRDVSAVPVVSLIDINSVSMAELSSMAIDEMPNGIVIGERSYGGHGPLDNDINNYYAGELENPAFRMRTSTSMTKRMDGKCYEGIGVTPNIEVLFNEDEFSRGNDLQLNRAIEYIRTGK